MPIDHERRASGPAAVRAAGTVSARQMVGRARVGCLRETVLSAVVHGACQRLVPPRRFARRRAGVRPAALLGCRAFSWVGLRGLLHAAQSLFFVCAGLYLRVPKLGSRR